MAHVTDPAAAPVYFAAGRFVDRALRRGGSLFRGSPRVWSTPVLEDLRGRVLAAYRTGVTFDQRWDAVLQGAGDVTVQLAGEAMFVHLLVAADISERTARRLVEGTLARAERPVRVPAYLDAALSVGLVPTGVAFKARRLAQLRLLLDAVWDWRGRPPAHRRTMLDDPGEFAAWLRAVPHDGAQSQREALLHLVHPAAFEPIVSVSVKDRVVSAFEELVPAGVGDRDEALRAIRAALESGDGSDVSFTTGPLVERWQRV